VGGLLAALLALLPSSAAARAFTVDDLLRVEAFGQVSLDPGERRLVYERLRPIKAASAFDADYFNRHRRSELFVVDVRQPGPGRRLLPPAEGVGHVLGPWSPSGRRLVVYRFRDRRWTLGVFDVEQAAVRWLDVTPEHPGWGRTVQWRTDDALVVIARPDRRAPSIMSAWAATDRLSAHWRAARAGTTPTRTAVGSGAYRELPPAPPPNQLVQVDAITGRVRPLALGLFHDLELSPNGRYVAVLEWRERLPVDPVQPFLQGESDRRRSVRIVEATTAQAWLASGRRDVLPNLLTWSPASDALLIWTRDGAEPWAAGAPMRLDPARRSAATVDLGRLKPAMLQTGLRTPVVIADWLGQDPILYVEAAGRRDWVRLGSAPAVLTASMAEVPPRIAALDSDRFWIVAGNTGWRIGSSGAVRETLPSDPPRVQPTELVDLGQRFAFNNPWRSDAPPASSATSSQRAHLALGPNPRGSRPLVDGRTRASGPRLRVIEHVDSRFRQSLHLTWNGRAPVQIDRLNAHFESLDFASRHPVHHRSPSGEPLTSWLLLPPRASGPRPPLIVVPYPGSTHPAPPAAADPASLGVMVNLSVLTGAGYAVLAPSLPRGEEPGAGLTLQTLAAVDAAAKIGGFDPERLALWGHSFGGYGALAIAGQTDRFRAVVAANGVYELASGWGEFSPNPRVLPEDGLSIRSRAGWTETGQGAMGAPPWAAADRYRRNSPLSAADRISAPVLLIASDRDYIPVSQAEALFTALYRQNKDAVLLTYFGEGHVLGSPANIRDMTTFTLDWISRALAREPVTATHPATVTPRLAPNSPAGPGA
jgi:dipeptidyl aminopeptidase/acylaminoacyl peptidase